MTQLVTLDAKPDPITIDPARTVVIVVDMQNDFGSKGGMFDRVGNDISGIQKAVAPTARVLAAARRLGIKIVYLKMGYRSDLSDLGAPGTKNRLLHEQRLGVGQTMKAPDGREYRVLIRDDRMHNQHMRRVNDSRRVLQRLSVCVADRLHERADCP